MASATIYTSAEPCAMCAGAIFWSGIGRLVYGLSGDRLHEMSGFPADMLVASARDVLARAGRQVEVIGPMYEAEAASLFGEDVF
jgi:tRNA(Arg) A34 adenosine deaminase TadA